MGVNKVALSTGETLIDISKDTVTPQTLAKGCTAHNSNGEQIVGTMTSEGGSGGGIIDVTELPTSGVDENAVYRVTESYLAQMSSVWLVLPDEATGEVVVYSIDEVLGECEIYVVDTIEDMVAIDIETEIYVINILRTDGIAYLYSPEMFGDTPIPLGLLVFETEGLDKGHTQDPYFETEMGIYTTQARYDSLQKWFIRENGEWKEISAHIMGEGYKETLSGEYLSDKKIPLMTLLYMPCIGDIIEVGYPETLPLECFINSRGRYITDIRSGFFVGINIERIDLPESITTIFENAFVMANFVDMYLPKSVLLIGDAAFYSCGNLTTVTFGGTPNHIANNTFEGCNKLTTINVPWSEGQVANAPWGATNATINYNYTEG